MARNKATSAAHRGNPVSKARETIPPSTVRSKRPALPRGTEPSEEAIQNEMGTGLLREEAIARLKTGNARYPGYCVQTPSEPEAARDYAGTLRWADIGDDAWQLGSILNDASDELRRAGEIIGDQGATRDAHPGDLATAAREIRAGARRAIEAAFSVLKVAGAYETWSALADIVAPVPTVREAERS